MDLFSEVQANGHVPGAANGTILRATLSRARAQVACGHDGTSVAPPFPMREAAANHAQIADLLKTAMYDAAEDPGACFVHRAPESSGSLTNGRYLRFAVVSPYTALFPVLTSLLSAMCQTWWIFIIGTLMQLLTTCTLPRFRWFREMVDRRIAEAEEASREVKRARVRTEIGEEHRGALERLEARVKKVRERAQRGGRACSALLEEGLGLSELTAMFVRLAVALQARRERINAANPELIARRLRELERSEHRAPSSDLWVSAMRVRSSNLERLRRDVENIESVMASIVEYAGFLDECCVPSVPDELTDRIDNYLAEWTPSEPTTPRIVAMR
jgi:hypothetical protein